MPSMNHWYMANPGTAIMTWTPPTWRGGGGGNQWWAQQELHTLWSGSQHCPTVGRCCHLLNNSSACHYLVCWPAVHAFSSASGGPAVNKCCKPWLVRYSKRSNTILHNSNTTTFCCLWTWSISTAINILKHVYSQNFQQVELGLFHWCLPLFCCRQWLWKLVSQTWHGILWLIRVLHLLVNQRKAVHSKTNAYPA